MKTLPQADTADRSDVRGTAGRMLLERAVGCRGMRTMMRENGLKHIAVERYEGQDIALWCTHQGLESELIHATPKQQAPAFMALAGAAQEGRLHVHPKFDGVFREMETFEYSLEATGTSEGVIPRFQHAKGAHDDHLYALAWAIYSLRDTELNPMRWWAFTAMRPARWRGSAS